MKKRDIALILVSALIVLISFQGETGHRWEKFWVIPVDTSLYDNSKFPQDHEKLPLPVVTDLDGDGRNEVIVATADCIVKVFDPLKLENRPSHHPTRESSFLSSQPHLWFEPALQGQATTLASLVKKGRRPVAMATGYLSPFQQNQGARQQVLLVVTEGWNVLCFDHTLKLEWESSVMSNVDDDLYLREVAIIVTSHSIHVGDRGTVIVGGRLVPKAIQRKSLRHDNRFNTPKLDDSYEDAKERASGAHFSYYAFDGRTGARRWKHEPEDWQEYDKHQHEDKLGSLEHTGKLHLYLDSLHVGERPWRTFKTQIINSLPHIWETRDDTVFKLDGFSRDDHDGGQHKQREMAAEEWSSESMGVPLHHVFGANHQPHSEEEHIEAPNVIIAHVSTGLEVVHLYTGRPITNLRLGAGLYADLTGDNIIEVIRAFERSRRSSAGDRDGGDGGDAVACRGTLSTFAESSLPELLFNVSICEKSLGSSTLNRLYLRDLKRAQDKADIQVSNPLVIRSGIRNEFRVVFLAGTGLMSCFSSDGDLLWQLDTPAFWSINDRKFRPSKKWHSREQERNSDYLEVPPQSSLLPFAMHPRFYRNLILAVGKHIALISGNGELLSSTRILGHDNKQAVPIQKVVIGDVNSDGISDVIVPLADGYYAYTLHSSSSSLLLPILVAVFIITVISLAFYRGRSTSTLASKMDRSKAQRRKNF